MIPDSNLNRRVKEILWLNDNEMIVLVGVSVMATRSTPDTISPCDELRFISLKDNSTITLVKASWGSDPSIGESYVRGIKHSVISNDGKRLFFEVYESVQPVGKDPSGRASPFIRTIEIPLAYSIDQIKSSPLMINTPSDLTEAYEHNPLSKQ